MGNHFPSSAPSTPQVVSALTDVLSDTCAPLWLQSDRARAFLTIFTSQERMVASGELQNRSKSFFHALRLTSADTAAARVSQLEGGDKEGSPAGGAEAEAEAEGKTEAEAAVGAAEGEEGTGEESRRGGGGPGGAGSLEEQANMHTPLDILVTTLVRVVDMTERLPILLVEGHSSLESALAQLTRAFRVRLSLHSNRARVRSEQEEQRRQQQQQGQAFPAFNNFSLAPGQVMIEPLATVGAVQDYIAIK